MNAEDPRCLQSSSFTSHICHSPVRRFPVTLSLMANPTRVLSRMAIRGQARPSGRLWNPAADVYQGGNAWIIKVDLAGVLAEELELVLGGSDLIIRGCRRDTFYREGFTYQQMEISYSRFEKHIEFPCTIDPTSVTHEYHDGFLIINLRCK